MKGLWGKLWFRLPVAILAGPIIMTVSAVLSLFFYLLVVKRGYVSPSDLLPDMNTLGVLLVAGVAMMLPPLIVSEIVNRRRAPLPPSLCAAFLALLAVFAMAGLMAAVQITQRMSYVGNWQMGVAILTSCYLGAAAVSFAIVSPLIRRWRQRSATVAEIAENF